MTRHAFTVFDAVTGAWLRAGATDQFDFVAAQSLAGSEIVFEGIYAEDARLVDGWPEASSSAAVAVVTVDQVKHMARKLIEATEWKLQRHRSEKELGGPTSISDAEYLAILVAHASIRARSDEIELMVPIPHNFRDASFWP